MTDKGNIDNLMAQDKRHHFHPQTNPVRFAKDGPNMVERAEGVYLYVNKDKKIIDCMSGAACVNIGYGNERLCKAAYETMRQLSFNNAFGGMSNPWIAALSDKLALLTPDSYQQFFFASTGSDAVESAIKMALYYWQLKEQPQKRKIISRQHAYHGLTGIATSLTGIDQLKIPFGLPLTDIVHHADSPYWYRYGRDRSQEQFGLDAAASLERMIKDIGPENIAAFIGEPIQLSEGMIIPPDNYWPEVRRICERNDILFIADEVAVGFGKTGDWFGFQSFSVEPDMFTMAKGISSGYFPISSVALGAKVSEVFQSFDKHFAHGYTNCGHPVGAAVALENIAVIEEENLIEKVRDDIGPYLATRLKEFLTFPFVGEIRSMGVLGAIEIDLSKVKEASLADSMALAEKIGEAAWDKGLSARLTGSAITLIMPLIITRQQVDDAINILKEAFAEAL